MERQGKRNLRGLRMKKGLLAVGFFIISALVSGCNQPPVEEIDLAQFKQFMEEKETGVVMLTYYTKEENVEIVKKVIEDHEESAKHFGYAKENTENDRYFLDNHGIEQNIGTLAYYKDGVLKNEFNFPHEWDSEEEELMKLNKFVEEIKMQES